jgi:hypothetical protein
MRDEILSDVEPGRLLHIVFRRSGITDQRQDIVDPSEGLQVAAMRLKAGQTFRPHRHVPRERTIPITQECWVVISGVVGVRYYDLNGAWIASAALNVGDVTITLAGGHTYECLSEDAEVIECKTGPYTGTEGDKEFIHDPRL